MQLTNFWIQTISLCLLCILTNSQNPGTCQDELNCDARGVCITQPDSTWYCRCDDGWATYPTPDPNSTPLVYCNYEQKQQLVAFLLSFFIGAFGAGRFYVGLYMSAGLKIGLSVGLGCCGICIISCVSGVSAMSMLNTDGRRASRMGDSICARICGVLSCCYVLLVSLGIVGWCIADWVLFGLNELNDGNGVELKAW